MEPANNPPVKGLLGQIQLELRRRLSPHRHTAVLVAIVLAFLVRPFTGDSGAGPPLFSLALFVLLLLALYSISIDELVGDRSVLLAERRRLIIVGWTLGVVAIVLRFMTFFVASRPVLVADSTTWLFLFAFIAWNQLRAVLRPKEITREVISLSISVYLLFGLTFGLFYILIHELQPNSFNFGGAAPANDTQSFAVLTYFSFTTLSTIGYGDITPVSLQARYVAVTEGITGQFYLAILVARLVGMQMSQSANSDRDT